MTKMHVKTEDEKFLLALRGKPLKKVDLRNQLTLSDSTFKAISERLRELKLVRLLPGGFYELTANGRTYLAKYYIDLRPQFKDEKVGALVKSLPTEPHQALFRLLLSGIVARKYLYDHFTDGWCGAVIGGRTLSFKTRLGRLVCNVLNLLPESSYIRNLITATAKEILGRRDPRDITKIIPSPFFDLPFVTFDELQKGDAELKRAVMFFLDGSREFKEEKTLIKNRCCCLVTSNLDPRSEELGIPDEYIRRSVVVNTKDLAKTPVEYDEATDEIFSNPIPRIKIDNLQVFFRDLEKDERDLIRSLLYQGTGERDVAVFDTQSVKILTLGWLILTQGRDPKIAVFETCYDKLVCLETLNLTVPGWRDMLLDREAEYRGETDPIIEKKRLEVGARRQEQKEREEIAKEKKKGKEKTEDDIRADLVREYAKIDIAYKNLISDMKKAEKLVPGISILLAVVKDDKDRFGGGRKDQERLEKYQRALSEDREASQPYFNQAKVKEEAIRQGKLDKEGKRRARGDERANLLWELKEWRHKLNKTGEPYTPAIQRLRERGYRLSMDISHILKRPGQYSIPMLREALRQVKRKASPWLVQYEEDSKDLGAIMAEKAGDAIIDGIVKIGEFIKGKGGGKGKKRPPKKPTSRPGYGGRNIDDI